MTPRLSIALNSPYFLSQSLAFIRISKDLSDSGPVILHALLATACPIGEGNGTPLQYSCLENRMDGRACRLQSWGR